MANMQENAHTTRKRQDILDGTYIPLIPGGKNSSKHKQADHARAP